MGRFRAVDDRQVATAEPPRTRTKNRRSEGLPRDDGAQEHALAGRPGRDRFGTILARRYGGNVTTFSSPRRSVVTWPPVRVITIPMIAVPGTSAVVSARVR